MSLETQTYLKAVSKTLLQIYVSTGMTEAIQSLVETVVNVPQKDLVFAFLKALHHQFGCLERPNVDPRVF